MVSVATPSERARVPKKQRLVVQRAKISFSHGQCVDLGVLIPAELVPANDKWLKKQ